MYHCCPKEDSINKENLAEECVSALLAGFTGPAWTEPTGTSQKWLRASLDVPGRFPSWGASGLAGWRHDFDFGFVAQQTH